MLRLAIASLRRRKGAVLGGLIALFCAAAMVSACGALLETGLRGTIAPQRYSGAPVVVTADQQVHWITVKHKHDKTKTKTKSKDLTARAWLPSSVGTELAQIPGATVVAEQTFTAQIFSSRGEVVGGVDGAASIGHNWSSVRLTPYTLVSGDRPASSADLVIDSGIAASAQLEPGDRVTVQSTSSPRTYTISGIVRPQTSVTEQSALFFSDDEATRLAGRGDTVAAYGVFGATAEEVDDALGDSSAQIWTGQSRGAAEFRDAATARTTLTSMSAAIGGTALIVAMLVVAGTFSLSVQQRSRELALLRAIGATPRQVRRLISREALVLGLVAAVPGALVGIPLATAIYRAFVSLGTIPETLQLARSPLPIMAAAVASLAAAVGAARIAARRTTRIRPTQALTEAATEPVALGVARSALGLIVTAVAALVTGLLTVLHTEPAAMPVTYLAVLLWILVVALLGPLIVRVGVAMLGAAWRLSPVGGFLAARTIRANSRRFASVITPLALLVAMATTILCVPATMTAAVQAQTDDGLSADQVVVSSGSGVPDSAANQLRTTPTVRAAVQVKRSMIWIGRGKHTVTGVSTAEAAAVLDPDISAGSLADLEAGTIAMSARTAGDREIGATVQATLPDGTEATFTLVAIYERDHAFGDVVMSFATLSGHVDNQLADAVLISGSADKGSLQQAVADFPGLQVTDQGAYQRILAERQQTNAAANLVFLALIIAFAGIAVVNTLAMATLRRSGELSLIRMVGATTRQIRHSLRWELAIVVACATAVGSLAAGLTLTGFSIGMTGQPIPSVRPLTYAAVVTCAVVLGAIATFAPAHALLRRDPTEEHGTDH
ncbi:MAG: FtsX-like permease family protein [Nocardioides sp.]|nr:FtsX-like permease family protein [Nocardioides sp.]